MKKLLPAALLLTMLTGCGANHLPTASSLAGGAIAAQSKAVVEKGIHAMFKAAFVAADKNGDGKLSPDEMPTALPAPPVPGMDGDAPLDPASADAARQALFADLDFNKDGVVTFREFSRPDGVQAAINFYRTEVAKVFTGLDKNGDHVLTANELQGTAFQMDDLDANMNDKVTLSEFENAFVKKLGGGPDPVPAPGPVNPPAPAPAPSDAPAPGGDPAPAPQS